MVFSSFDPICWKSMTNEFPGHLKDINEWNYWPCRFKITGKSIKTAGALKFK